MSIGEKIKNRINMKVLEIVAKFVILIPGFLIYLKIEQIKSISLLTPLLFWAATDLIFSKLPMNIIFKKKVGFKSNVLSLGLGMILFLILLRFLPQNIYILGVRVPLH